MLLNAKNAKTAYSAFRDNAAQGTPEKQFTNDQLALVHKALAEKHPLIADQFGADVGIRLMNKDSMITEIILSAFLQQGVPALSLHDSYIIPAGHEEFLIKQMYAAFKRVMGVKLIAAPWEALKEKMERVDNAQGLDGE